MAVPTIATITPGTGLSRGRTYVLITGTNFAIRAVGEGSIPKVKVTFDGMLATDVREESATRVTCITPAVDPKKADVVLSNLTAAGVPVVGETVTSVGGYVFKRPDLTTRSRFQSVMEAVIKWLAREVIANVVWDTDADYDALTGDLRNLAQHADLPVIVIDGPRFEQDDVYGVTEPESVQDNLISPTTFETRRPPKRRDLVIDITLGARNKQELMTLVRETGISLEHMPQLLVESDPSDPLSTVIGYDVDTQEDFDLTRSRPNPSGIHSATATLVVRGVPFDDGETVEKGPVLQLGDKTDVVVSVIKKS